MGRRITDGMSYRDILRQHLPGHTYVLYSNDPVMLESIASAVYQFNAREGKKCNLWLHKRRKNITVKNGTTMKRMEIIVYSYNDHVLGRDKNWKDETYTHEEF
jgi:hypothetical protein